MLWICLFLTQVGITFTCIHHCSCWMFINRNLSNILSENDVWLLWHCHGNAFTSTAKRVVQGYLLHSSPKETQVFGSFFWARLYATGPGIVHCFPNSRHYVRVSHPGAVGKLGRLDLRFFWRRVYNTWRTFWNNIQRHGRRAHEVVLQYWKSTQESSLCTVLKITSQISST